MIVTFHKVSQQIIFLSTKQLHAFVIFGNHILPFYNQDDKAFYRGNKKKGHM